MAALTLGPNFSTAETITMLCCQLKAQGQEPFSDEQKRK